MPGRLRYLKAFASVSRWGQQSCLPPNSGVPVALIAHIIAYKNAFVQRDCSVVIVAPKEIPGKRFSESSAASSGPAMLAA